MPWDLFYIVVLYKSKLVWGDNLKNKLKILSTIVFCGLIVLSLHFVKFDNLTRQTELFAQYSPKSYDLITDVPEFANEPFVIINDNIPYFQEKDLTTSSFEKYSQLDSLGRCGTAMACIGVDIMPTKDREGIGQIKPSGWHTVKYDNVDGKYLYNRCHLIGYQLTGENANAQNLITGTRYLNNEGMLPFEDLIADYVKKTENHVLYRVTPIFIDENLLASGVQMEAKSVEDNGEEICFNIYLYNAHPDITIDYATGNSYYGELSNINIEHNYILNTKSKKIHRFDCSSVDSINAANKESTNKTVDELIDQGYSTCKQCNP